MKNTLRKLIGTITARDLWVDHFLLNDEPNCEISTYRLDVQGESSVRSIRFGFCHRSSMEKISDVPGYDQYARFTSAEVGDTLEIEYLVIGKDPDVLTYMGGHTAGRGPVLGLDNRTSAGWLSIVNQTQGWEIDLRKNK